MVLEPISAREKFELWSNRFFTAAILTIIVWPISEAFHAAWSDSKFWGFVSGLSGFLLPVFAVVALLLWAVAVIFDDRDGKSRPKRLMMMAGGLIVAFVALALVCLGLNGIAKLLGSGFFYEFCVLLTRCLRALLWPSALAALAMSLLAFFMMGPNMRHRLFTLGQAEQESAKTEPAKAEAAKAEPAKAEPTKAEPDEAEEYFDPAPTTPSQADPDQLAELHDIFARARGE